MGRRLVLAGWLVPVLLVVLLALLACQRPAPTPTPTPLPPTPTPRPTPTPAPPLPTPEATSTPSAGAVREVALEALRKGGCVACHTVEGVPGAVGTLGPDLSRMGEVARARLQDPNYRGKARSAEEYIRESIEDPDVFVVPGFSKGMMPANLAQLLSPAELDALVRFLAGLPAAAPAPAPEVTPTPVAMEPPPLTPEEFEKAKQIYFNRCAGCHGTLRKGATGPALTPDRTLPRGTAGLAAIIFNGTPRGMPAWGREGILTQEEVELMAKFIQHEPPAPPEMSMAQMKETWNVFVPPEERPDAPRHTRNWENFFSLTLRDAGQVAIIDGDTKEVVTRVDTGFAVHISRMSATGRYVYTIGRDGKAVLIDLWMDPPRKVAEVQVCYDARSIEVSKYRGELGDYHDRYAIVGCYWPPHFVILDGQTLEPLKVVSTRSYTYDTEEFHPEPRVASIVASHFRPEWVVNVKETGLVWLVDYSDPHNPTIKMIEAERFLHDGGWDSTKRYFLVAANRRDKIAVVDTKERRLAALVEVGKVPHPGRGVNFVDPEYGPVWCTVHLGEGLLACIGTDPEGHPDSAWKVVRRVELPGTGSLFVKTHPNSPWIWVDFPLDPDEARNNQVCVIPKEDPTRVARCLQVGGTRGRAVHLEYNKDGTEMWVSVWDRDGEVVVFDDRTLEVKHRITGLMTPTGKFNVYNTARDIY